MHSARYRIKNPWGLHARASAYLVRLAMTCSPDWDIIVTYNDREADAKSIVAVMKIAAGCGAEIEFLSLMPEDRWQTFTAALESLFFVTDHLGNKANAYEPVERILKRAEREEQPVCQLIRDELVGRSANYNCDPFFEREDSTDKTQLTSLPKISIGRVFDPFDAVDVFVSYDSAALGDAIRIYDALLDRKFKVFLAAACIPRSGTSDFQLAIERALVKAKSMIVVGCEPQHFDGQWVRTEWTAFLNEQRAGRKAGNLITVRSRSVEIVQLPLMLRTYQSEISPIDVDRVVTLLGVTSCET